MSHMNAVAELGNQETQGSKLTSPTIAVPTATPGFSSPHVLSRARARDFTASLRIPVHKSNREYLRALRAAELAAWKKADRNVSRAVHSTPAAGRVPVVPEDVRSQRYEALFCGLLAAAGAVALVVNAVTGLSLVASWQRIEELVRSVLL